jgi:hypothetical protein
MNRSTSNVKLLLLENLPRSNNDMIVVKLAEPVLKNNSNVKINKDRNLEFDLSIAASAVEKVTVKYTIEYPSERQIDFY